MTLLILVIALALIFDFINGFHDAANSIATIVTTRVLTPFQAVLWAAAFNFIAFFVAKYIIGEFGIADTVSKTVLREFIALPMLELVLFYHLPCNPNYLMLSKVRVQSAQNPFV
jgi:PiT family inorganic phosphate transporter